MTFGQVMLGVSVMVSAIFGDNIGSFIISRVLLCSPPLFFFFLINIIVQIISVLTETKYSRNLEHEADYIGCVMMNAKGIK